MYWFLFKSVWSLHFKTSHASSLKIKRFSFYLACFVSQPYTGTNCPDLARTMKQVRAIESHNEEAMLHSLGFWVDAGQIKKSTRCQAYPDKQSL